jgi:hypothetical protein
MNQRILLFVVLILAFAVNSQAYIYEIEHQCQNSCLQGTGVAFNITIDPGTWKDSMELRMIQVIDAKKGTLIAVYNETAIFSSKKGFYINATLPKYEGEPLINVSPCFTTMVPQSDRMADDTFIANELTYCEKGNHTLPLLECMYSASCDDGSSCINNSCAKLKCGECQRIFDHRCLSYQCCGNESCKAAQQCLNNSCISFECAEGEFAENHTCAKLYCNEDEYVANHSCVRIEAIAINTSESTLDNETKVQSAVPAGFIDKISGLPKNITSDVLYKVLEVIVLGAIVFVLLKLLEAKTKIFIKLTNRGQK